MFIIYSMLIISNLCSTDCSVTAVLVCDSSVTAAVCCLNTWHHVKHCSSLQHREYRQCSARPLGEPAYVQLVMYAVPTREL